MALSEDSQDVRLESMLNSSGQERASNGGGKASDDEVDDDDAVSYKFERLC